MTQRHPPPDEVVVEFRSIGYLIDLRRCRRALVWRQIEGDLATLEDLAAACNASRSTISRFFAGRHSVSLDTTLRILARLKLRFEDVATPVDQGGGTSAVRRAPVPA